MRARRENARAVRGIARVRCSRVVRVNASLRTCEHTARAVLRRARVSDLDDMPPPERDASAFLVAEVNFFR